MRVEHGLARIGTSERLNVRSAAGAQARTRGSREIGGEPVVEGEHSVAITVKVPMGGELALEVEHALAAIAVVAVDLGAGGCGGSRRRAGARSTTS